MGAFVSSLWLAMFPGKRYKIVMFGIGNSGKTTILYKLHSGKLVVDEPTVGSNIEELVYKNIRFEVWDLGGQHRHRTWPRYYRDTDALIVVIDSTDKSMVSMMKDELFELLDNEKDLQNSVVLVFANKQDLKEAMKPAEITEAMSLHSINNHLWHIEPCSALTGHGLKEGFTWIAHQLKSLGDQ